MNVWNFIKKAQVISIKKSRNLNFNQKKLSFQQNKIFKKINWKNFHLKVYNKI